MRGKLIGLVLIFTGCWTACTTSTPQTVSSPQELPSAPPARPVTPENPPVAPPSSAPRILDELAGFSRDRDPNAVLAKIEEKFPLEQMVRDDKIVFGQLLIADSRFAEAKKVFVELVGKNPQDKEALVNLAISLGALGETTEQKRVLQNLLSSDPGNAQANALMGQAFLAEDNPDRARTAFEVSMKLSASPEALLGLATIALEKKNWDGALDYAQRGLDLDPANDAFYALRSKVYAEKGLPFEAEKAITKAIELAPDFAWHYLDRARLAWLKLYKPEAALTDLEKVLSLEPEHFFAHVYKAEISDSRDEVGIAYDEYKKALELKPDYRFAYAPLSVLAFTMKDWELAHRMAREAFLDYPGEYAFPIISGLSLRWLGRADEAKNAFDEGYRRFTKNPLVAELFRFFQSPRADFNLNTMIDLEKDLLLKTRIQVYQACQYWIDKQPRGASVILQEVAVMKLRNVPEVRMARLFLKDLE